MGRYGEDTVYVLINGWKYQYYPHPVKAKGILLNPEGEIFHVEVTSGTVTELFNIVLVNSEDNIKSKLQIDPEFFGGVQGFKSIYDNNELWGNNVFDPNVVIEVTGPQPPTINEIKYTITGRVGEKETEVPLEKVEVKYRPEDEKPENPFDSGGPGKKRVRYGHVAPRDKDREQPKKTIKYFSIDNENIMNWLRRKERYKPFAKKVLQAYRPAVKQFVMEPDLYRKFRNWAESESTIRELGPTFFSLDNSKSFTETELTNEGLGSMADIVERDHEVQMARADLYKLAKYAIKLHEMLKHVSEAEGMEGWQQSKITKAADYISSVYHSIDYDQSSMSESKKTPLVTMSESNISAYKTKLSKKLKKLQ